MRTSARGLDFISRWEGTRLEKYRDQAGLWTIGTGHLIKAGEVFDGPITREKALSLLNRDVQRCEEAIARAFPLVTFTQSQYDSLVSFCFNTGIGNLWGTKISRAILAGRMEQVPDLLLEWCHAGGKELADLKKRRRSEGLLWSLAEPPPDADDAWHMQAEQAYSLCFDLYDPTDV